MVDLLSRRAQGHGPVHLLLIFAAELGFALRMMNGPVKHFYSSILDAWRFSAFSKLSERKGFLGG